MKVVLQVICHTHTPVPVVDPEEVARNGVFCNLELVIEHNSQTVFVVSTYDAVVCASSITI